MWIAIGSLLVSILALWRAGRVRVLDLRTDVRKDVVELRLALENLAATIPVAVQSRERVSAAAGMMGGAMEQFRAEARADTATVETLRGQLGGIEPIPLLASYNTVEAKAVTAQEVRVRVQALRDKYLAAADTDAKTREHLRASAIARRNRS